MSDEVKAGKDQQGDTQQIALLTFTNDKSPENMGLLQGLLKMVIHTVFTGSLACMQSKNAETGEQELILVGVQTDENGNVACYPLFKPLRAEDVSKYLAPNGSGGFIGETEIEA